MKRCARCGEDKPLDQFLLRCGTYITPSGERKQREPRPHSYCKLCFRKQDRATPRYGATSAVRSARHEVKRKRARRAQGVVRALETRRTGHIHSVIDPMDESYRHLPTQMPMLADRSCERCATPMLVAWRQGRYVCGPCKLQARRAERRRRHQRPEQRAWRNLKKRCADARRPHMLRWGSALHARWAYYGGRCWMCGDVATQWDHVKPLARGGHPTLPCNLRPACGPCNVSKADQWAA